MWFLETSPHGMYHYKHTLTYRYTNNSRTLLGQISEASLRLSVSSKEMELERGVTEAIE